MFEHLSFMSSLCHDQLSFNGQALIVSRLGYTGEDGFEVSVPNSVVNSFMEKLMSLKMQDSDQSLN